MAFNKKNKKNREKVRRNGIEEDLSSPEDEDIDKPIRKPFSILGNVIFLTTIAIIVAIGWLVAQTWIPQDLSNLPGYRQSEPATDIPRLLQQAYKKNSAITLSEEDVNRYIASTLKASQHGMLSFLAKPNGVGIKFHDGYMEIIIERKLGSALNQTVSLFVTVVQLEDPSSKIPITKLEYRRNDGSGNSYINQGGTIGNLSVPQGYIIFLKPAFENLAAAYQDLLSSIIDNGRIIRINRGHIDLIPGQQGL